MGNGHSQNYVLQNNYAYTNVQLFGPGPNLVHCPSCNQKIITKVKHVSGRYTWGMCSLFIVMGFLLFRLHSPIVQLKMTTSFINVLFFFFLGFIKIKFLLKKFLRLPCWCCSLIPYMLKCCKDVEHYCSHCNTYIGKYFRDEKYSLMILPIGNQQQQVNQNQPNNNN